MSSGDAIRKAAEQWSHGTPWSVVSVEPYTEPTADWMPETTLVTFAVDGEERRERVPNWYAKWPDVMRSYFDDMARLRAGERR